MTLGIMNNPDVKKRETARRLGVGALVHTVAAQPRSLVVVVLVLGVRRVVGDLDHLHGEYQVNVDGLR